MKNILSRDRIREIVDKVSYHPNISISVGFVSDYEIIIHLMRVDAYDASTPRSVDEDKISVRGHYSYNLEWCDSERAVVMIVEESLRTFEQHEFKEWFKYNGCQVYDPHPQVTR